MNGLYAVVLALAHSSEVLGNAQKQAQEDVEAANLVNAVLQKIKDFNNNMEQIQKFLQSYIDEHAPGTKEGGKMTAGERSAVSQLSTMLDTIKADQTKINSETTLVKQYSDQATDCFNSAANITKNRSGWDSFVDYIAPWVQDSKKADLLIQGASAATNATQHQHLLDDANRDQMATLSVKTGSMSGEANTLSTKAQSALDQLDQIMRAGFLFLSMIDNKEKTV